MPNELAAEVLQQDGPIEAQVIADTTDAAKADATAGEVVDKQASAEHTDDEPEGERHKRLGGWQRQIHKLKQQVEQRDSYIESLLTKDADAKAKPADKKAATASGKPSRPKLENFTTMEEFDAALDKYEDQRDEYLVKRARDGFQQESEQKKAVDNFTQQIAAAKQLYPDFVEVSSNPDLPVTDAMREALLTSEHGALIVYELGKNPDEAARISKLTPVAQIREIGKIEARISAKSAAGKEEKPAQPQSRAPKPPTPVQKASAADTGLRDDLPWKDWVKRREAQLQGK